MTASESTSPSALVKIPCWCPCHSFRLEFYAAPMHTEQVDSGGKEFGEKLSKKERRRQIDARYRAAHRERLRQKAVQYRHEKKRNKQNEGDEAEFQRLMSLDFDTVHDDSSTNDSTVPSPADSLALSDILSDV